MAVGKGKPIITPRGKRVSQAKLSFTPDERVIPWVKRIFSQKKLRGAGY